MDNFELAQEGLEHAHHSGAHDADPWMRRAAVLIAALAAGAVIAEMSANDAQTNYLASHIAASDAWTQYQAKSVRRTVLQQSAISLEAAHADPAAAAAARGQAERMQAEPTDGMEALASRAHADEHRRDHERHLHEGLERGVRGLQIAIVLVSLFVVTRATWLLAGGAALGLLAGIYALLAGVGAM